MAASPMNDPKDQTEQILIQSIIGYFNPVDDNTCKLAALSTRLSFHRLSYLSRMRYEIGLLFNTARPTLFQLMIGISESGTHLE